MNTTTQTHAWELRFDWTLSVLMWGSLALGAFLSATQSGATPDVVLAAVFAGGFAIMLQVTPRNLRSRTPMSELIAVTGVVAGLASTGMTGGVDSPYLLFLAAPTFFASAFLTTRIGLETAALSVVGLVILAVSRDQAFVGSQAINAIGIYALIAVTFSQARRILVEARAETEALKRASIRTADKVDRLSAAHNLLSSLTELADASELNPVAVGEAALRDLSLIVGFRSGEVGLVREGEAVIVAARGEPGPSQHREEFPMVVGGRRVGFLGLWPDRTASFDHDRDLIEEALRPVGLAFDNILLLQTIAKRAVREERTRLARELHDDIGPSLASLGLGIDVVLQQYPADPELVVQLDGIRSAIIGLVDQVRTTVADLREEDTRSLVSQAQTLASEVGADGPSVFISIDERRPPRPALAPDLSAILTEAVRNAIEHSGAREIEIEGLVDHEEGRLVIRDNGKGFDTATVPQGHFGLVGMRERALRIGASLSVESAIGSGTRIAINWSRP